MPAGPVATPPSDMDDPAVRATRCRVRNAARPPRTAAPEDRAEPTGSARRHWPGRTETPDIWTHRAAANRPPDRRRAPAAPCRSRSARAVRHRAADRTSRRPVAVARRPGAAGSRPTPAPRTAARPPRPATAPRSFRPSTHPSTAPSHGPDRSTYGSSSDRRRAHAMPRHQSPAWRAMDFPTAAPDQPTIGPG